MNRLNHYWHTVKQGRAWQAWVLLPLLLLCLLLLTPTARANAPDTGWLTNPDHPPVTARIALTGQGSPDTLRLDGLLSIRLQGDWKTYWRSPGEGGVAPELIINDSQNLDDITWHWPAPKRHELLGLTMLGYKGQVTFPLTFKVETWQQPVSLDATLRLSSCTSVCVITDYPISLDFTPSTLEADGERMYQFNQAMSQVPKPLPSVQIESAVWDTNQQQLAVTVTGNQTWQQPDMLVDGEAVIDDTFGVPSIHRDGDTLTATFDVTNWIETPNLTDKPIQVTVMDKQLLAEHATTVKAGNVVSQAGLSIWMIGGIALLGGLILNVMPCVLPVLGLKLNSIVANPEATRGAIRGQFLASAAGILVSFWAIAGLLMALKLTGQAVGWGIQFQSPLFIGVMTLVIWLFALSLFDVLRIDLPPSWQTWMATRGGHTTSGHFVQGVFATLLATPCSAPFLGTAVAYALGGSLTALWLIFTALAVGMALPWLLVAAFPGLTRALPKPGPWMNHVKRVFALLLAGTTMWLFWLWMPYLGVAGAIAVGTLLLVASVWLTYRTLGKLAAIKGTAGLLVVVVLGLIGASLTAPRWATPLNSDPDWVSLDEAAIDQAVDQGKVVFVDVTADWCITCHANKVGVILQSPVYDAITAPNVVAMQGDWTRPSDTVTQYLQEHQRYGVPFNIVYGPGAPEGIALPVILTDNAVMTAIEQAKTP
ncbi:cytochrome C biogenesis protein [Salinivibrio kushneri]|uniref:Cytochrome C biogenesis protein n=1 Tax=Salinivibrio kushneri TaxID=1908198 RepID=A0AB36JW86_9GAMM|nr:protein-disulfide reductase DsbD domain-containing protein [Salinivibrio kushneri]OOE38821.1 cytochrome C biogenesis protein [Salinivibrio kushneri]QCP02570.1 cytochrome C biogenesis protein [Salinivibrio kushneri]